MKRKKKRMIDDAEQNKVWRKVIKPDHVAGFCIKEQTFTNSTHSYMGLQLVSSS